MKTLKEQKLIRVQVSRRLEGLRPFKSQIKGVSSWIDYIRSGLGMSITQLASRVGVNQSTMSTAIKLEKEGRITLARLQEIAEAMECDLVYAFVPKKKIEEIVHDEAVKKTLALMKDAETHMSLEDQQVTIDKDERLKDLVEERMYSKYLWDK